MKVHPLCRNVRSVLWIVEKTLAQTEVTYGKSRVIVVISKSSFFPRGKRGEFRGAIVGMIGPRMYIGPWALSEGI